MKRWLTTYKWRLPLKGWWEAFKHRFVPETKEEWLLCGKSFGVVSLMGVPLIVWAFAYTHSPERLPIPAAPAPTTPATQFVTVPTEVTVTVPAKPIEQKQVTVPKSSTALPAQVIGETQVPTSRVVVTPSTTSSRSSSPVPSSPQSETVKPSAPPSEPMVTGSTNTPPSP